jgi:hypothetical protein
MRVTILVIAAACGSVNDNVDAPGPTGDAGPDGGGVPSGTIRWARSLSSASPLGVVEGSGGVVVTAYFSTTADFGGGVLTSQGLVDSVVVGFAPGDASYIYAYRYGTTGSEFGFIDDVDPQGAPFVVGVAYGPYDLGQGPQPGGGGPGADGFIGRYTPTGPTWVKTLVGPGEDKILDTALGPSQVFAIGWWEQTTTLEGTMYTAVGQRDVLFTRWGSFGGQLQLARVITGSDLDEGSTIAALGDDVAVAGFFTGTLSLGMPPLVTAGGRDIWVARLTPAGDAVWATRFGGVGEERDPRIATDAAGDVYLTGQFSAPIAFGAVNLVPVGGVDTFVTKLRGADGTVLWATSFGSPGTDQPSDLAVDDAGRAYVAAAISGPIEPGGSYSGGFDAVLVSLTADGGMRRWSRVLGTPGDDRGGPLDIGFDAVYWALGVSGEVDLGGVPIIGAPAPAGILLKIEP